MLAVQHRTRRDERVARTQPGRLEVRMAIRRFSVGLELLQEDRSSVARPRDVDEQLGRVTRTVVGVAGSGAQDQRVHVAGDPG